MIPMFTVVGSTSKTGKTAVLCEIIKELKARGYKVGTIKHDVHGFEIDHPGKDTWRHAQAGADVVAISSPDKLAMIEKVEREYDLHEVIDKIHNVDIIITEGYKSHKRPKLEVYREAVSGEIYSDDEDLFALVTDVTLDKKVPQFRFSETRQLADLIEDKFLKSQ